MQLAEVVWPSSISAKAALVDRGEKVENVPARGRRGV
jgi:hypothetical protein